MAAYEEAAVLIKCLIYFRPLPILKYSVKTSVLDSVRFLSEVEACTEHAYFGTTEGGPNPFSEKLLSLKWPPRCRAQSRNFMISEVNHIYRLRISSERGLTTILVCVCVCIRMYICMYVRTYVYMYICMYVRMNVHMYVGTCVDMYVCTFVCSNACMYVYVCMYVRICVCVCVCTYVCVYICPCVCT
jgi:hypothetical protein